MRTKSLASTAVALHERPLTNVLAAEKRLLFLSENNGQVFHCSLLPYRHEGWFMIASLLFESGKDTKLWCAALLSESAIAMFMAAEKETNTAKAIASEMFEWSYGEMIRNQEKSLIVPSVHGCFFGKWNEVEDALVLNAWSAERYLYARETEVLNNLRRDRTVLVGDTLTN